MIKSNSIRGIFAVLCAAGFLALAVSGCNTAQQASSVSISGTISGLAQQDGLLYIIASTTTEGIPGDPHKVEARVAVSAGDTSKDFSITVPGAGTYYVVAVHFIGTGDRDPAAGDKVGQYADGYLPPDIAVMAGLDPALASVPAPIVVNDVPVTGKNFTLNVTWGGGGTIPPATGLAISGTIAIPDGLEGTLWFGAGPDPTFQNPTGAWPDGEADISAGQRSYDYTLTITDPGTYYVLAVLFVGAINSDGPPKAGDRFGQYANGYIPVGFGQSPTAYPDPIEVIAVPVTGRDFELKGTWVD